MQHARLAYCNLPGCHPRLLADDGPKAAAWLAEQCAAFPVLRPLCLVLKGLLAEQRLADAATGGLR